MTLDRTVRDYTPFVEYMIMRYEGPYGWSLADPGGPTKYGITCFDLAEFMHEPMDSMTRWAPLVRAMSLATADQIYAVKYATACRFNELHPGKDCEVFDFGVNSGPSRAIKCAQAIVGVAQDGFLGPATLDAINAYPAGHFINHLSAARLNFLRSLSIWPTFRKGWSARVADLRRYSWALLQPAKEQVVPTKKLGLIPLASAKGWPSADDLIKQYRDKNVAE